MVYVLNVEISAFVDTDERESYGENFQVYIMF